MATSRKPGSSIRVAFALDTTHVKALNERVGRLRSKAAPLRNEPLTALVQYLRGANSRAMMSLPAFYLFLGSHLEGEAPCSVSAGPGVVLTHWLRFSSLSTATLSCRKIFDHAIRELSGGAFSKASDDQVHAVAEYWAKRSGRTIAEAESALMFLRRVLRRCSKSTSELLKSDTTLGKRIGLLKQHADRVAAHLSLEDYEFSVADLSHVVAAMAIVGEVIRSFDDPWSGDSYYDNLDHSSHAAATAIFPALSPERLFQIQNVHRKAAACWTGDHEAGERLLFEELPYAIGWF